MSNNLLIKWVGGPLDGAERLESLASATGIVGQTLICGHANLKQSAYYRWDDSISEDGILYARFIHDVPRRER
jgi:hypothetical protein